MHCEIGGHVHQRRHEVFAEGHAQQQESQREGQRQRVAPAQQRQHRQRQHGSKSVLLDDQHITKVSQQPAGAAHGQQGQGRPVWLQRQLRQHGTPTPHQPQADWHDDVAVSEGLGSLPDRDDGTGGGKVGQQGQQQRGGHPQRWLQAGVARLRGGVRRWLGHRDHAFLRSGTAASSNWSTPARLLSQL